MDDASTAADPVSGDRPVQRLSSRRCARTFLLTRWADVFGNGGVDRDGEAAAGDHFVNGYPPVLDQWRFDADTRDACAAQMRGELPAGVGRRRDDVLAGYVNRDDGVGQRLGVTS